MTDPYAVLGIPPESDDETIRTFGGMVFDRMSKTVGPKWIDSMVEQQVFVSIIGVIELVRNRPAATLHSVFRNLLGVTTYRAHEALRLDRIRDDAHRGDGELAR